MFILRKPPPVLVALLALLAYAWAFSALMGRREGDVSWFVVAGGPGVDPEALPPGLSIFPEGQGYDGLYYYRLALDPFTRAWKDFGITFDNPAYRQQRILYPLIVHVLSFGRVEWVPALMVIVNLLAVGIMTWAAAMLAARYSLSPWWGLLIPLYPGLFIAFSRDTTEIVAWAFAVSALYAFTAKRWTTATVLLCGAVLSRETTLVLALSLAAVYLLERRTLSPSASRDDPKFPARVCILPIAVYAIWQLVLRSWWGVTGLEAGAVDAVVPFSGFWRVFLSSLPRRDELMRTHFAECIFLAALALTVLLGIRRSKTTPEWRLACVVYLGLGAILANDVWGDHMAFMRVLADLYVMSAIVLFGASARARWVVAVGSCSLSYYVMLHMR